jgi:hypothetical protein
MRRADNSAEQGQLHLLASGPNPLVRLKRYLLDLRMGTSQPSENADLEPGRRHFR